MSSNSNQQLRGSWRTALGKVYLAAEDFEIDQKMTVQIESVTQEDAIDPGTKKPKKLLTLHFQNTPRTLALNVTNSRRISAIVGSPRVEKWPGHQITLHLEEATAFGKRQQTIRVKETEE